jgi:ABC-type sugar transport system ATPase subunit
MARIELRDVVKRFGRTDILRGVSLTAGDGELLVLVGPSGCGKSTLLRIIAGLEAPTSGEVWLGDARVDAQPPQARDLAMVFQSYALYPHMTVEQNLAFGLRVRKAPRSEIDARVREAAARLGLEGLLERYPRQLSGGQRQRVAMGRALVRRPKAFLFDEPLSNLDATLRAEVRVWLKRLHAELGATMVYVTHDQVEAMTLATRIAVLRAGEVVQVGTPLDLYERPANQFVAGFIGHPPMNFLPVWARGASLVGEDDAIVFDGVGAAGEMGGAADGRPLRIGVRPHDLRRSGEGGRLPAVVEVQEPLGAEVHVHARVGRSPVVAVLTPDEARDARPGAHIELRVPLSRVHLFDATTEARIG